MNFSLNFETMFMLAVFACLGCFGLAARVPRIIVLHTEDDARIASNGSSSKISFPATVLEQKQVYALSDVLESPFFFFSPIVGSMSATLATADCYLIWYFWLVYSFVTDDSLCTGSVASI